MGLCWSPVSPSRSPTLAKREDLVVRYPGNWQDFAWERYYDLSSSEIGELIRFPKMGLGLSMQAKLPGYARDLGHLGHLGQGPMQA